MNYQFECEPCGLSSMVESKPFQPPEQVICPSCGKAMDRVYGCNIDTSGCRDADEIPSHKRVLGPSVRVPNEVQAQRIERAYAEDIKKKRELRGDARVRKSGEHVMTHSIPAHLHHGKIRETGDKHYWDDPKNLNRHRNWRI